LTECRGSRRQVAWVLSAVGMIKSESVCLVHHEHLNIPFPLSLPESFRSTASSKWKRPPEREAVSGYRLNGSNILVDWRTTRLGSSQWARVCLLVSLHRIRDFRHVTTFYCARTHPDSSTPPNKFRVVKVSCCTTSSFRMVPQTILSVLAIAAVIFVLARAYAAWRLFCSGTRTHVFDSSTVDSGPTPRGSSHSVCVKRPPDRLLYVDGTPRLSVWLIYFIPQTTPMLISRQARKERP